MFIVKKKKNNNRPISDKQKVLINLHPINQKNTHRQQLTACTKYNYSPLKPCHKRIYKTFKFISNDG